MGHFLNLDPPNNTNNPNFEKTTNDAWFLRCRVRKIESFVILGCFLPFCPPPNNPDSQNFKKMKKTPGDIIILHISTINENHDLWFLRYGVRQTEFFLILDHFLPFYLPPPNNPENQNFVKNGNKYLVPGDIIILHKCTKYDKHMIYGFWDMKHNRQIFFVILGQFLPFYPTSNPKNQNFEKKNIWRYYHFTKVEPKIMIICYTVPEIWHMTEVYFYFHFQLFFALLPP